MKLLPAPRFHIMSADEIDISRKKIFVEFSLQNLRDEFRRIEWALNNAEDFRDYLHNTGIYAYGNLKEIREKLIWEWYYQ